MKKVLYMITSLAHKRVFETFEPRSDIEQLVVGPMPKITNTKMVVPEDYSDFRIKNMKFYWNNKEKVKIVNEFKPDIYVIASLPFVTDSGLKLPGHCKKVYVSHGMVGSHVKGIIKKAGFNTSVWKGGDLYCGATKVFAEWVKHVAKVGDDKILLNALPQLDILYNSNYYNSYRDRVLARTKFPDAKKVVLLVGFCCKDRFDFDQYNEEYFQMVIGLERIAKQNDWLIMVKPRQTFPVIMKFLNSHGWGRKYSKKYSEIQNSKNLYFIKTTGHIYRYFFADAIVLNGTSTVEVEACAINKPLFIYRKCLRDKFDPFGVLEAGAGEKTVDVYELGHLLETHFKHGDSYSPALQTKLIRDMGIGFDGLMHKRIQDKLANM